jgi:hypothetical protein
VAEAVKLIGIALALCLGALFVDYGCYYQATIFTTLDGSSKGMDPEYRDPTYHPFALPVLWAIAAVALIPAFLMLALGVSSELLAFVVAGAVGTFFFARWFLMRRGIS